MVRSGAERSRSAGDVSEPMKGPGSIRLCLDQSVEACLGIRGIWVSGSCRRQKVASLLLDNARYVMLPISQS